MSLNQNLQRAKREKNDEFYTQLSDIENELRHYTGHFAGKVVLCNCDDPRVSNFFHYFSYNFERLGLKKLIIACYKNQDRDLFSRHDTERAIWLEYKGNTKGGRVPDVEDIGVHAFEGDGDFRSAECIELLKHADIVVTNPPFSLFRGYVAQLVEYGKKFLIIGSKNAVTYKEIFPLIIENRVWFGYGFSNGNAYFKVADVERYESKSYFDELQLASACWHVTIEHSMAIVELVHATLHGSALVLVRSIYEAYLRGMWLMYAATDEEIDRAGRDKFPPNSDVIMALEKSPHFQSNPFSDVKAQSWKMLCSYTHTGYQQIGARLPPQGLGYNYQDS